MYDLLIIYRDGEVKTLKGVSEFELLASKNVFMVTKNGYRMFFPVDQVKFIGREFDYRNR